MTQLIYGLGGLILGFCVGFFVVRRYFILQLKKHPPITEKAIKAMFLQMGRKPSETQIKTAINAYYSNLEKNNKIMNVIKGKKK